MSIFTVDNHYTDDASSVYKYMCILVCVLMCMLVCKQIWTYLKPNFLTEIKISLF